MPLAPSLRLPIAALLLAGLACKPTNQPDSKPPGEVADVDDDKLPERPPIERSGELMATGQHAEALAVLDEALRTTPDDPELLYARGIALEQLGKPQDAVAA
ncbi:MAG: tetratricopeptide repeat protein, partial [Myxococcales bacterium]|nr:tetratricopeptide repeat protein [Myxococcales bacterium]